MEIEMAQVEWEEKGTNGMRGKYGTNNLRSYFMIIHTNSPQK